MSPRWRTGPSLVGTLGTRPARDPSPAHAIGFTLHQVVTTRCDSGGPEDRRETPRGVGVRELVGGLCCITVARSGQDPVIGEIEGVIDVGIGDRRQKRSLGCSRRGACSPCGACPAGAAAGTTTRNGSTKSMRDELSVVTSIVCVNNRRPPKTSPCPKCVIGGCSSRLEISVLFDIAVAGPCSNPDARPGRPAAEAPRRPVSRAYSRLTSRPGSMG